MLSIAAAASSSSAGGAPSQNQQRPGAPGPRVRGTEDPSSAKQFSSLLALRGYASLLAQTREHPALLEPLAGHPGADATATRDEILERKARALLATYYNWNHRAFPKLAMRDTVSTLSRMGRAQVNQLFAFEQQERQRRQRALGRIDAAANMADDVDEYGGAAAYEHRHVGDMGAAALRRATAPAQPPMSSQQPHAVTGGRTMFVSGSVLSGARTVAAVSSAAAATAAAADAAYASHERYHNGAADGPAAPPNSARAAGAVDDGTGGDRLAEARETAMAPLTHVSYDPAADDDDGFELEIEP